MNSGNPAAGPGTHRNTNCALYLSTLVKVHSEEQQEGAVFRLFHTRRGFPGGSDGEESACNAGDPGSIPRSGRSPGEGNGNPLQYSCLESSMDRRAWWAV